MFNVLVTGAYGFIGKHLVPALLSSGYNVYTLEHTSLAHLSPFDLPTSHSFFSDITDFDDLDSLILPPLDAVFHLAGQSSGPKSFLIPDKDLRLNALGTLNIIKLCHKFSISRLLFASSFVVYGRHESLLLSEDLAVNPVSVYASSKLYAENLLSSYAEPLGIKWNSLRMFNVYGPGQDITKPDQGIVGIFLNQLLTSPEVVVKGSTSRTRDLVYIDDVVSAWLHVFRSTAYNQVFNVGSGSSTSIDNLIHLLAAELSIEDSLVIHSDLPTPGDLIGACASLEKITSLTGFIPKTQINKGLSTMIQHYA